MSTISQRIRIRRKEKIKGDTMVIGISKNVVYKNYVSHYSNKNGQFILRNVKKLCIIYITFLASAFSLATFLYYTHIKHALHFIHSFSCYDSPLQHTFHGICIFGKDDSYRCACCLLCLHFFVFYGEYVKKIRRAETHMT